MVKKFLVFLLLFTVHLWSQDVKVSAGADTGKFIIGDPIRLRFEVIHIQTAHIMFPDLADTLKPFEILSADSVKTFAQQDGKVKELYSFTIAAYDSVNNFSKSFAIPYVIAGDTAARYALSNAVSLAVARVKVDTTAEIKDVKDPLAEKNQASFVKRNWWWMLIIVAVILAVAGFFIYREKFRKPGVKKEPVIILTLEQLTLKKLKELEDKQLWQKSQIKEYHSEITEIIREFFEKRYGFNSLKLTTTETVNQLEKRATKPVIADLAQEFLSLADMVKFAKYIPPFETNERMHSVAYQIVEQSKQENNAAGLSK